MNSDHRTERQLEDWLEDEARAMPDHVLEAALEAVSRTTQIGRKGRFAVPWLNQRFLAVAMAAAVVVLAVIAAPFVAENLDGLFGPQPGTGPAASRGEELLWDPAADFLGSPNQMNPSPDSYGNPDVWSYLRSVNAVHNPPQYYLLPNFQVADGDADQWFERDMVNLFVARVPGSRSVWLHPYGGEVSDRHNAILSWRSPIGGLVTATGVVQMAQPTCSVPANGITFSIDRGGQSLRTIRIGPGQDANFEVSTSLAVGESLYFIVDSGGPADCDSTLLTLAITHQ